MQKEEESKKALVPIEEDAFDCTDADEGATSRIVIDLSFGNDFTWTEAKSGQPAPSGELLVVAYLRQAIRFNGKGERPDVEDIPANVKMQDFVDALNAKVPRDQWRADKFTGVVDGGWRGQHVLLFLDETTYDRYRWSTRTVGGVIAVDDIRAKIKWKRRDVPGALPYAILGKTFFPTNFGDRERPHLIISKWKDPRASDQSLVAPPTAPTLPSPGSSSSPAPAGEAKASSLASEMDDEIPF